MMKTTNWSCTPDVTSRAAARIRRSGSNCIDSMLTFDPRLLPRGPAVGIRRKQAAGAKRKIRTPSLAVLALAS